MSEANYTIRGRDIFSARGKLVATLDDDGNPVMAPGMAGPHTRGVREFLADAGNGDAGNGDASSRNTRGTRGTREGAADEGFRREAEGAEAGDAGSEDAGSRGTRLRLKATPWQARGTRNTRNGAADEDFRREAEGGATLEEYSISTIPVDELPEFSREYGVNTPGFGEFVKRHNLTSLQVAALVKRLENR